MITEDYVSYETAKLLKERGFDGECRDYYSTDGHFYSEDFKSDWNHGGEAIVIFSAPTLQMAMKWLREVYNLFISISIWLRHKDGTVQYYYEIRNLNNKDFETIAGSTIAEFDSPEKTYEAAIKYCLEKLI